MQKTVVGQARGKLEENAGNLDCWPFISLENTEQKKETDHDHKGISAEHLAVDIGDETHRKATDEPRQSVNQAHACGIETKRKRTQLRRSHRAGLRTRWP